MMSDIWVMTWKELKEYLLKRNGLKGGWGGLLVMIAVLGIFLPFQFSSEWLTIPMLPLIWLWMPVFFSLGIITDSIAGERERHTLETLLSSRLPDNAILLGKMLAAVLYSFTIAISGFLIGALTVNIAHPGAGIRFYDLSTTLGMILLGILAPMLLSGLGVLVSLKAETARQAYQRLSIATLIVGVLPNLAVSFLPQTVVQGASAFIESGRIELIILAVAAALIVINAVLISICLSQFKRAKLALIV